MRELHEECGVLGIYGVEQAPRLAFLALQALQHRGQQGCGMVVAADNGSLQIHKGAGLVKDVFKEEDLFRASGRSTLCTACFSGRYPTDLYGHEE